MIDSSVSMFAGMKLLVIFESSTMAAPSIRSGVRGISVICSTSSLPFSREVTPFLTVSLVCFESKEPFTICNSKSSDASFLTVVGFFSGERMVIVSTTVPSFFIRCGEEGTSISKCSSTYRSTNLSTFSKYSAKQALYVVSVSLSISSVYVGSNCSVFMLLVFTFRVVFVGDCCDC